MKDHEIKILMDKSIKNLIFVNKVLNTTIDTPNDTELGSKIRKLVYQLINTMDEPDIG